MSFSCINAAIELYLDVVELENGSIGAYLNPFDEILADVDNEGHIITHPFWVVVRFNILGGLTESERTENFLSQGAVLGFRLNLTKNIQLDNLIRNNSRVLDMFELDLKKIRVKQSCRPYTKYTRLIKVPSLKLPGDCCDYDVKLVAREMKPGENLEDMRDSGDFAVQSMTSLLFKPRKEIENV